MGRPYSVYSLLVLLCLSFCPNQVLLCAVAAGISLGDVWMGSVPNPKSLVIERRWKTRWWQGSALCQQCSVPAALRSHDRSSKSFEFLRCSLGCKNIWTGTWKKPNAPQSAAACVAFWLPFKLESLAESCEFFPGIFGIHYSANSILFLHSLVLLGWWRIKTRLHMCNNLWKAFHKTRHRRRT